MTIKKSEAKYTDPFKGRKDVMIMMTVQDGASTASAASLDYDTVHALEKLIVVTTFEDDAQPDCQWK